MIIPSRSNRLNSMQISSRFTLAVHILACIATFQNKTKVTSEFLASSTNVNPVIVRNILSLLKRASIVSVQRGSGGAALLRDPEEITFLDLYRAVECIDNGQLFHFHENPSQLCPVGRNIHRVLDGKLDDVQKALEDKLGSITLASVTDSLGSMMK